MEGHCSTDQSPLWAVVPMEEKEEEEDSVFILIEYYCRLSVDAVYFGI